MVTIKDIARKARVSIATVSHVLSGSGRVSPETRERVKRIATELGYRPNLVARSLKSRRTHTIGMVISDITNPFFPEMVRGAEDAATSRGYMLATFNTDDRPERERLVFDVLQTRRLDGVLLVVALERTPMPHVEEAIRAKTPIVCLDRRPEGLLLARVDAGLGDRRPRRRDAERSQVADRRRAQRDAAPLGHARGGGGDLAESVDGGIDAHAAAPALHVQLHPAAGPVAARRIVGKGQPPQIVPRDRRAQGSDRGYARVVHPHHGHLPQRGARAERQEKRGQPT